MQHRATAPKKSAIAPTLPRVSPGMVPFKPTANMAVSTPPIIKPELNWAATASCVPPRSLSQLSVQTNQAESEIATKVTERTISGPSTPQKPGILDITTRFNEANLFFPCDQDLYDYETPRLSLYPTLLEKRKCLEKGMKENCLLLIPPLCFWHKVVALTAVGYVDR